MHSTGNQRRYEEKQERESFNIDQIHADVAAISNIQQQVSDLDQGQQCGEHDILTGRQLSSKLTVLIGG